MTLLECKNLSFSYDSHTVVDNINFKVEQGDWLSIIGENGSGKSTLLKGILKLKTPSTGEIIYENIDFSEIGYLPQQTDVQKDFPASVFEVVLSGRLSSLKKRFFYNKEDKKIAEENLEIFGMTNLKNRSYQKLSGGQQQKVLLARAFGAAKKLVVMDEPVTALDSASSDELYSLIKTLNEEYGVTVIMVSHDIESVLKYSTHILHIEHDQLFFGKTEEYKNNL